jgi:ABC-type multidrug transport system ATPase subunit
MEKKMDFGFVGRWILGELEMLELRNVCKAFGDVWVLDGVNLRLEKGFVYTLMGGNGSGKTTLVNSLSYNSIGEKTI